MINAEDIKHDYITTEDEYLFSKIFTNFLLIDKISDLKKIEIYKN